MESLYTHTVASMSVSGFSSKVKSEFSLEIPKNILPYEGAGKPIYIIGEYYLFFYRSNTYIAEKQRQSSEAGRQKQLMHIEK